MQFTGTYTALVTPFRDDRIDAGAFARLIDWQIDAGVDGFVAVGTTGESATLDHDEHLETIRLGVEAARGRCKVIAGTGSNSTREAIALTQAAEGFGADAALVVTPYYNKPSQEGLYRHYRAVAEATKLPVLLYSVPSRCGVEIGTETARRLAADCANVVAIKEAGGSADRVSQLRAVLPNDFTIISGDDALTLPFLAAGRVGGHQRHLEHHPSRSRANGAGVCRGRCHGRAAIARAFLSAAQGAFHRAEPGPGQDRPRVDEGLDDARRTDAPLRDGQGQFPTTPPGAG